MPMTTTYKNAILTAIKGGVAIDDITHAGAHTLDPGGTGANEISGGAPAYARKSVTFGTVASGSMSATNQPVIDVPASTTLRYLSLWTAVTAGTVCYEHDVPDEAYTGQGTYTITAITLGF